MSLSLRSSLLLVSQLVVSQLVVSQQLAMQLLLLALTWSLVLLPFGGKLHVHLEVHLPMGWVGWGAHSWARYGPSHLHHKAALDCKASAAPAMWFKSAWQKQELNESSCNMTDCGMHQSKLWIQKRDSFDEHDELSAAAAWACNCCSYSQAERIGTLRLTDV